MIYHKEKINIILRVHGNIILGGIQMKKRHKRIRNSTVILTVIAIGGLFIYGQKVKAITKNIDRQIEIEQAAIDEKNEKLVELQAQIEEIDSPEYIKKIATEELVMVEEDTIVFKVKE